MSQDKNKTPRYGFLGLVIFGLIACPLAHHVVQSQKAKEDKNSPRLLFAKCAAAVKDRIGVDKVIGFENPGMSKMQTKKGTVNKEYNFANKYIVTSFGSREQEIINVSALKPEDRDLMTYNELGACYDAYLQNLSAH